MPRTTHDNELAAPFQTSDGRLFRVVVHCVKECDNGLLYQASAVDCSRSFHYEFSLHYSGADDSDKHYIVHHAAQWMKSYCEHNRQRQGMSARREVKEFFEIL